jgi:hypothetical protein
MNEADVRFVTDFCHTPYDSAAFWPTDVTPVEAEWFAVHDERHASRTALDAPCTLRVPPFDVPIEGRVVELSHRRALVHATARVAVDSEVLVSFTPPACDQEIDVLAIVTRRSAVFGRYGSEIALAFEILGGADAAKLRTA